LGSGEWGVGSGEWGVGSGEWGVGSGKFEILDPISPFAPSPLASG